MVFKSKQIMNKTTPKETINESRLWKCDNCGNNGELVAWGYDDLVMRGEPVCPFCDADMILISTTE